MFFHEDFVNFDQVFGVSNESGTYDDWESYNLDPKLNLTLTALLRFCTELEKNIQPLAHVRKKISRMTRVKIS